MSELRVRSYDLIERAIELLSDRQAFAERHREASGSLADEDEIERLRQESLDAVSRGGVRLSGEGGAAFGAALEHAVLGAVVEPPALLRRAKVADVDPSPLRMCARGLSSETLH